VRSCVKGLVEVVAKGSIFLFGTLPMFCESLVAIYGYKTKTTKDIIKKQKQIYFNGHHR